MGIYACSFRVRVHRPGRVVLLAERGRGVRGRGGEHARSRETNPGAGLGSAAVHGNPVPGTPQRATTDSEA
jgi:hypothetical protein